MTVWWESPRFPRDYVYALSSQVPQLIVLSTHAAYRQLLEPDRYADWWSKLEVFRPENRDIRPCLFIDLDTFIVGNIDPILELSVDRLWLIREFMDAQSGGASGMFIAPRDGVSDTIWRVAERLTEDHFADPYGDGGILRRFPFSFIPDYVDGIYSYKSHALSGGYPGNARVICFHGEPKPMTASGWAKEYFEHHVKAAQRAGNGSALEYGV